MEYDWKKRKLPKGVTRKKLEDKLKDAVKRQYGAMVTCDTAKAHQYYNHARRITNDLKAFDAQAQV